MVQVAIKTTAPGIPDIYRGCELWDISYVDPDNRRPVDYILRQKLVNELKQKETEGPLQAIEWAMNNFEIGAAKLLVTRTLLRLRKEIPDVFLQGDYIPLQEKSGDRQVIAYVRGNDSDKVMVILPLGIVRDKGKPLALTIPADLPTKWTNLFTGEEISGNEIDVHRIFEKFPVAVLKPV